MAERLFPVLIALLVVAAACSGSDDAEDGDASGSGIAAVETSADGLESAPLSVDDSGDGSSSDSASAEGDTATAADADGSTSTANAADGSDTSSSADDLSSSESTTGGSNAEDPDAGASGTTASESASAGSTAPPASGRSTTTKQETTTAGPTTTERTGGGGSSGFLSIDWWGCWRAADAMGSGGSRPANGGTVNRLPNCANGPSSVGSAGDMFGSANPPVFRSAGAGGHPSIEFTHTGDTLLQTNGGAAWSGGDVLASSQGVTVVWVGMLSDVDSHDGKFAYTGIDRSNQHPSLYLRGRGPNLFSGYGGGNFEIKSPEGTIRDFVIYGVILHFSANGEATIQVNGGGVTSGDRVPLKNDVRGLTLGNAFRRNFSSTDHQFIFMGLTDGQLSSADRSAFWGYVNGL